MSKISYHRQQLLFQKEMLPTARERQIIDQLNKFQDGYSRRDTSQVEAFMESLYSRENILILGTMPGEVFSGYDRAASSGEI